MSRGSPWFRWVCLGGIGLGPGGGELEHRQRIAMDDLLDCVLVHERQVACSELRDRAKIRDGLRGLPEGVVRAEDELVDRAPLLSADEREERVHRSRRDARDISEYPTVLAQHHVRITLPRV